MVPAIIVTAYKNSGGGKLPENALKTALSRGSSIMGGALVMADTAVKTANVDVVTFASPDKGTARSNEIIVSITGDSGAVKQSLLSAQDVGLAALETLGGKTASSLTPTLV